MLPLTLPSPTPSPQALLYRHKHPRALLAFYFIFAVCSVTGMLSILHREAKSNFLTTLLEIKKRGETLQGKVQRQIYGEVGSTHRRGNASTGGLEKLEEGTERVGWGWVDCGTRGVPAPTCAISAQTTSLTGTARLEAMCVRGPPRRCIEHISPLSPTSLKLSFF